MLRSALYFNNKFIISLFPDSHAFINAVSPSIFWILSSASFSNRSCAALKLPFDEATINAVVASNMSS